MALTNPYFQYPGFPFSGYNDIEAYNEELIQLNEYIKSLTSSISSKILLHISMGSAAEELYMDNHTEIDFLWQQLFPEHLQNSTIPVIHIIVSNSRMFHKKYIPLFVKNTPELMWDTDLDKNTIKSKKLNITVKMFYTGMPSKSDYSKIATILRTRNIYDEAGVKRIEQTSSDREYIEMFYTNLEHLFSQINSYGGFVTCYSYAVFRKDSEKGKFDGYHLFQEIKKLFSGDYKHSKRLLAEWIYRLGVYSVIIFNADEEEIEDKCVCFCKPRSIGKDTLKHNDIPLLKCDSNLKLVIWDNPYRHIKSKVNDSIDLKDSNSLYTCLMKVVDDPIFWDSISKARMHVFNRIVNELSHDNLMVYLKHNEDYRPFHCDFNMYHDYIISDGTSEKGQQLRSILGISGNSSVLDILEIDSLAYFCKMNICVVDHNNKNMYSTKYDYNKNIVLIYDESQMIFKPKHMKFEDTCQKKAKVNLKNKF